MEVSVHEAKADLSQLLERVSLGEEVIIIEAGKPVARLVPAEKPPCRRQLGWAHGEFTVPEDFDVPLSADLEETFYR